MRDDQLGIDTMGLQDEPCRPEREPTVDEKIDAFDLRDYLRAVYSMSGSTMGCCDEIERDDAMPGQVNYSLHLCWDADEPNYQRVVLESLERIVNEARRRGALR